VSKRFLKTDEISITYRKGNAGRPGSCPPPPKGILGLVNASMNRVIQPI